MDERTPKPDDDSTEAAPDDSTEAAPDEKEADAERKTEPELSPAVARRVQLSLALEEVLSRTTPEIEAAHAELVAAVLAPNERPPDMATPLDCYRRVMALSRTTMVVTDRAHSAGLERIATLIADRELIIAAVSKRMARTRRACSGWFGRGGLGRLGLAGPVPKGRKALFEQAREAARRLRLYASEERRQQGDREPPPGDDLDVRAWLLSFADKLDQDLDTLELIVNALDEERGENKVRFDRRQEAIAEFDPRYLSIGGLAEAILRLTGNTEEADRIHPSTRQLDRKVDDEGEDD